MTVLMTESRRVLFLCTGNYYRSRYAEVFNHNAGQEGLAWVAVSRGVSEKGSPDNVGPISPFALNALQARDISAESATRDPAPCSLADFEGVELVVALKQAEHRPLIEGRFPGIANRIEYGDVDDIEIADPATTLSRIDQLVARLIENLRGGEPA
jgi:protein-tyrosine phosphatase